LRGTSKSGDKVLPGVFTILKDKLRKAFVAIKDNAIAIYNMNFVRTGGAQKNHITSAIAVIFEPFIVLALEQSKTVNALNKLNSVRSIIERIRGS
jgi:hypothetical protein